MTAKLKILIAAARIRMGRGQTLEQILAGWPRLTQAEKNTISGSVIE